MTIRSNVAAILLAAGKSSRMGEENKLLIKIAGKAVIEWSLEHVLASSVNEIVVVGGHDFEKLRNCLSDVAVAILQNRDYQLGMSASLRVGIGALSSGPDGALILLADQANLQPQTINCFLEAFKDSGKKIIAAKYGAVIGNPVLFDRALFPGLCSLAGDVGARSILMQHPHEVATIEIPPEESLDIDTPADLEKMRRVLA
ncbi:MAG: NTP transferase domain-containing protein [bacterium]